MFEVPDEGSHSLSMVLFVGPRNQLPVLEIFLCSTSLVNVLKVLQILCESLSIVCVLCQVVQIQHSCQL